jgi:hypothetical protein
MSVEIWSLMRARRPYVAMQIDLGPQCDALVESGTSIDLNISLRVFSYRAHGETGGWNDPTVVDKTGVRQLCPVPATA